MSPAESVLCEGQTVCTQVRSQLQDTGGLRKEEKEPKHMQGGGSLGDGKAHPLGPPSVVKALGVTHGL